MGRSHSAPPPQGGVSSLAGRQDPGAISCIIRLCLALSSEKWGDSRPSRPGRVYGFSRRTKNARYSQIQPIARMTLNMTDSFRVTGASAYAPSNRANFSASVMMTSAQTMFAVRNGINIGFSLVG